MASESTETNINVPDYIRCFLLSIANKLGLHSDINLSFKPGSNIGDGVLGSITSVTISSLNSDDVHLVYKAMPESKETRDELNLVDLFKREVFFYQNVFPIFDQFQLSKDLSANSGFFSYAKCYGCICDEENDQFVIVMEDVRQKNFKMWPKKELANLNHVEIVVKEIAKFHAVSMALNDQQPDKFAELTNVPDLLGQLFKRDAFLTYFKDSHDKMLSILSECLPDQITKLRNLSDNAVLTLSVYQKPTEPFNVLAHGDLWSNNLLFHYDKVSQAIYIILNTL